MLSRHAPSSKDPLHERLGAIPLKAWETELPALELCIQETLRLTATGAALRRNTYGDLPVAGKIVKRGWFMVYSAGDVHLNPGILFLGTFESSHSSSLQTSILRLWTSILTAIPPAGRKTKKFLMHSSDGAVVDIPVLV